MAETRDASLEIRVIETNAKKDIDDIVKNLQKYVDGKKLTLKVKTDKNLQHMLNGSGKSGNRGGSKNSAMRDYYSDVVEMAKKANDAVTKMETAVTKKGYDTSLNRKKLSELRSFANQVNQIYNTMNAKATNQTYKLDPASSLAENISKMREQANLYAKETNALSSKIKYDNFLPDLKKTNFQTFDKLGNRLNEYFEKYKGQIERNQRLMDKYQSTMHKLNNGSYRTASEANMAFSQFRMECRKAGVELDTFGAALKRTFNTRIRSELAGAGIYKLQMALRQIVQNSIEVDTAMTELKKVTNETNAVYSQFLDSASTRAAKLGATLSEVVNATADYARLGYSLNEATTLADSALIYQNVADGIESIDDATAALISTMQGFGIQASDSMTIVDKFNHVSNNYASSAGDIGEIVKRSAASMSAAGNSLEQTIALGVGANEVQQDADTVGTALKTMSMRLRGSKSELEAAGLDVEGMASSTSKLREEMMALTGVDIMIDDDTFKSSYDILMGIGEVWDQLTDVSRANVTEILFGKRQTTTCLDVWKHAS